MTQNQFLTLCNENCIDPDVALDNDDLCQALKDRDDDKVIEILTNEF